MTQLSRAEVIDGLLAQQLNPGQTADGVPHLLDSR